MMITSNTHNSETEQAIIKLKTSRVEGCDKVIAEMIKYDSEDIKRLGNIM